ncbi:hypothetical protein [Sphingobium sp.]|uniref:hypothetical protein n=1 Tax=Sphingobium sp. TaxID=1912891 RepID=UPI0028BE2D85|nr:hypothetical protein [Sphingobium sp.]
MMAFVMMTVLGLVMVLEGISELRHKAGDSAPLSEAVIFKAMGADPLPLNSFDRIMARIHAWGLTGFGFLVALIGILAMGGYIIAPE